MTADGTLLPLPGLYVLDSDGNFLASTPIRSVEEVTRILSELVELNASGSERIGHAEEVSIRVSGFLASAGIT